MSVGSVVDLLTRVGDIKIAGVGLRGGGGGSAGTTGGGGSVLERRIGPALALRRVCVLISLWEGGCECGCGCGFGSLIASSVYFLSMQPGTVSVSGC